MLYNHFVNTYHFNLFVFICNELEQAHKYGVNYNSLIGIKKHGNMCDFYTHLKVHKPKRLVYIYT